MGDYITFKYITEKHNPKEVITQMQKRKVRIMSTQKKIVVIDPGHYDKYNRGVITSYYEGTKMFILAQYLKESLEATGAFIVYLTKTKVIDDPSLVARGQLAITKKADVFLSLHSDAFSNPDAYGAVMLYSIKRPNSKALGEKIGKNLAATMKVKTGISYLRRTEAKAQSNGSDWYGVLRAAVSNDKSHVVPYVYIVEHGFHTNKKECEYLNNDANLKELALTHTKTLCEHFGVKCEDKPTAPINPPKDSGVAAPVYGVLTNINGYSTANNAQTQSGNFSIVKEGTYYVFKEHNKMLNITTDKTGKTPGWWINPATNISPIKSIKNYKNNKGI